MNITQYPKTHGPEELRGFSAEEIRRGIYALYIDITCSYCGLEQPVSQTGYLGGDCCRCGMSTDGHYREEL